MSLALCLLTLSFAAPADDAVCQGPPGRDVTYRVRFLDVEGLSWRSTYAHAMTPAGHNDGATAWTIDRVACEELAKSALARSSAGKARPAKASSPNHAEVAHDKAMTEAPKLTAAEGATGTVHDTQASHYVASVRRIADGPPNQATSLAFSPEVAEVKEGCSVSMAGRILDQGILAKVSIDDRRVTALNTVAVPETYYDKPAPGSKSRGKERNIACQYQVPQFVHASIDGEWLIPTEKALVVALGAHTTADATGRAVVRERIVLIVAGKSEDQAPKAAATFTIPDRALAGGTYGFQIEPIAPEPPATPIELCLPLVAPKVPLLTIFVGASLKGGVVAPKAAPDLAMPAMPSRSMPQGIGVDGSLPPLPDDSVRSAGFDAAGVARPSPQAGSSKTVTPSAGDGADVTADLAALKKSKEPMGSVLDFDLTYDGERLARLWEKPEVVRVPMGRHLVFEITAKLVPAAQAKDRK